MANMLLLSLPVIQRNERQVDRGSYVERWLEGFQVKNIVPICVEEQTFCRTSQIVAYMQYHLVLFGKANL